MVVFGINILWKLYLNISLWSSLLIVLYAWCVYLVANTSSPPQYAFFLRPIVEPVLWKRMSCTVTTPLARQRWGWGLIWDPYSFSRPVETLFIYFFDCQTLNHGNFRQLQTTPWDSGTSSFKETGNEKRAPKKDCKLLRYRSCSP